MSARKKPQGRRQQPSTPEGAVTESFESRMMLAASEEEKLKAVVRDASDEYLAKRRANVRGLGIGVKWTNGQPTGEPALVVLVSQKLPENALRQEDVVPPYLEGVQTDVLAIGEPFAGNAEPAGILSLARRVRPAKGGYSVGHFAITTGTIATCVYDAVGFAIPPRLYILSNNHVLANSNAANPGDPILQPGPSDGGTDPSDTIARLTRFIPITFEPPTPREQHQNLVDAAIAEGQFHDLDREIYWIGHVQSFGSQLVGTAVKKTGRTTNVSLGRITVNNATLDVTYSGGRVARFRSQIVTTMMSSPGDSGSLILEATPVPGVPPIRENGAVGLLFGGSASATFANPIDFVQGLLMVRLTP